MTDVHYHHDTPKNEVTVDLENYTALLNRIDELEDHISDNQITGKNKYQSWISMAEAVDSWRIFPRIFITTYIYLLYKSAMWFMELEAPTMEQAGLISVVVGAGAAWFGLYANSGNKFVRNTKIE